MDSLAPTATEIDDKVTRARALMAARGVGALWLRRASSFAWATGGADPAINTASDFGVGALLITRTSRYLLTNNIEAPRFAAEDGLTALGWEPVVHGWHEAEDAVARLTGGGPVGADAPAAGAVDLSGPVGHLRARLGAVEAERYRDLSRRCAAAIDAAIRAIRPGQREHEIAALLAGETARRGVWPIVDLVATDERIASFRHPLPTDKPLARHAMLVLCGRRRGLVCSVTRFVHFGRLPDELRRRQRAVAEVDAVFLTATRPGATLGHIMERAIARYAATGFADEWRKHHQGGAAGYEPRETIGVPGLTDVVAEGMAFAWNPSITGAKSEDTILVGAAGNEVMTRIEGWPTIDVEIDGARVARPAVLEV